MEGNALTRGAAVSARQLLSRRKGFCSVFSEVSSLLVSSSSVGLLFLTHKI